MTTSRSRKGQKIKSIELTSVKFDSTCISLGLPFSMACSVCLPKMDIHTKNGRAQQKNHRNTSRQNRCRQMWFTKWRDSLTLIEGQAQKHNEIRTYLKIEKVRDLGISYPYGKYQKNDP